MISVLKEMKVHLHGDVKCCPKLQLGTDLSIRFHILPYSDMNIYIKTGLHQYSTLEHIVVKCDMLFNVALT